METTTALLENSPLIYITDTTPGIIRQKQGDTFQYYDPKGNLISDAKTLDRISKLVLPPAWENVWISPKPKGYLQATGYDAKHRKQYRYHDEWISLSQNYKFDKVLDFVEVLPTVRAQVEKDIRKQGMHYEKVLATTVWLIENTLIRIGNDCYVKQNKSYGLTTLKNKHVDIEGSTIKFSFKGKSGVYHQVQIKNKRVANILKQCQDLPGQKLLEYIDENGKHCEICSDDVNNYLKSISGQEITAKEYRTWGGTTIAAQVLDQAGLTENQTQQKKIITATVKEVSQYLRNKPSTCKKYYIHPTILNSYQAGYTLSNLNTHPNFKNQTDIEGLEDYENSVVKLLKTFATINTA